MKRSEQQRKEEVAKLGSLRVRIPPRTFFHDDNIKALRAEIEVIDGNLDENEIDSRHFDRDESDAWDHARAARRWLDGDDEDGSPSEQWEKIIKVNSAEEDGPAPKPRTKAKKSKRG